MSILKVARLGHPVLRERARKVDPAEIATPEFQKLIDDMFETLDAYDGIGLAAPQVHEGVRLVLVGIHESRDEDSEEGHGEARRGTGEARRGTGEAEDRHGEAGDRHGEAQERHGEAEDGDPESAGDDDAGDEEETLTVYALINPEITPIGREKGEDWEGCLSLPGLRGRVRRPNEVTLVALDREANRIETHLHGYPARVLQHEVDHLDGVLFIDRMNSFETLTFLEEYAKYWVRAESDDR